MSDKYTIEVAHKYVAENIDDISLATKQPA